MSAFDRFLVHDATLLRPATVADRYGDDTADWSNPTEIPVRGWFTLTSTTEVTDGREAIESEWSFSLPPDAPIAATDRVRRNEVTYEILGAIDRAETPDGTHHLVARLHTVAG